MNFTKGKIPTGKGTFLWMLFRFMGGKSWRPHPVEKMAELADQLKAEGFDWVAIKVVAGKFIFDPYYRNSEYKGPTQQEYLTALAPELLRVGIALVLWGYYYGSDGLLHDQTEGEVARTLEQIEAWQPIAFIVNAEWQFKRTKSNSRAQSLMIGIKEGLAQAGDNLPDIPIGLSSYKWPKFHPEFPWSMFGDHADFWAMQVYWEGAHNPKSQLERSLDQHIAISDLPCIPAGSAYPNGSIGWAPTVDDLNEFDAAVQELGLLGVHWWEYHYTEDNPLWKEAIAAHEWPKVEDPTPTPEPIPAPPVGGNVFYNQALEDLHAKTTQAKDELKRETL